MTGEQFRILLVTEDADDCALAALVLEQTMTDVHVLPAGSALDFADQLAAGGFGAAVIDRELQWADGEAVLEAVKRRHPECATVLMGEPLAAGEMLGDVDVFVTKTSRGFLELPGAIERALKRAQGRNEAPQEIAAYDRLVEQLPVGIFAMSVNGAFNAANEAVLRTLGYTEPDELLLRQLPDLVTDVDVRLRCRALLERSQARKDLETTLRRADGGSVRVSLSFWPVMDEHERAQSYEGVLWDLSTAAGGNAGGLPLEHLASAVSHDLQDPLQLISQYSNLLLERHGRDLDGDALRLVSRVTESASRMQTMIDGILEYSKISAGERPFQVVDMNTVVADAMSILEVNLQKQDATVAYDSLGAVVGDPRQLTRLMQNLIGNAIKFRGANPPQVSISMQERTEDWLLEVADHGIGIEPRAAERIFDMFQRLHTSDEYVGTGLGLAICRRVAQCHGGRIWVDSRPDEGAVFYVTLSKHLDRKLPGSGSQQQVL